MKKYVIKLKEGQYLLHLSVAKLMLNGGGVLCFETPHKKLGIVFQGKKMANAIAKIANGEVEELE